jgi:hypothetical protein
MTSSVSESLRKFRKSSRKMTPRVTGTISASRLWARSRYSYWPLQWSA